MEHEVQRTKSDIQHKWDRQCAETAPYLSCSECSKPWAECVCDVGDCMHIAAAQEMTGSVARLTHWDGYLQLDDFSHGKEATLFIDDHLFTVMAQAWLDYKAAEEKEKRDATEATRKQRSERPLADCLRFADVVIADYDAIGNSPVATWAKAQTSAWRDMGHSDIWIQRRTSVAYMGCEQCRIIESAGIPKSKWRQALVYNFTSNVVPDFLLPMHETLIRLLMVLEAPEHKEDESA